MATQTKELKLSNQALGAISNNQAITEDQLENMVK